MQTDRATRDCTRSVDRLGGLRQTRTVTLLLAGELHCHSCSESVVIRWAGVEPALPEGAWLRPGPAPRRRPAARIDERPRCGRARRDLLLAISSVFKELFGRVLPSPFRQLGASRSQGRREANPVRGGVGDRPATGASPLGDCSVVIWSGKTKEPPPFGSGFSTVPDLVKVLVNPSRAPPRRHWCLRSVGRRFPLVRRASTRATSRGSVFPRGTGDPGSWSRRCTAWTESYTHSRAKWKSLVHLYSPIREMVDRWTSPTRFVARARARDCVVLTPHVCFIGPKQLGNLSDP